MVLIACTLTNNRATSWHSTVQGGALYNAGSANLRNYLLYGNWIIYGGGTIFTLY